MAGWAELVDGVDLGGIFSLFYVMYHYRYHLLQAGRVMRVFHWGNLHFRTLRHVLLQNDNKVL